MRKIALIVCLLIIYNVFSQGIENRSLFDKLQSERSWNLNVSLTDDNSVRLFWEESPDNGTWLHWDNGINYDGIGAGLSFRIAVKFAPENLTSGQITRIRYFVTESEVNHTLKFWTGEIGDIEIYSQQLDNLVENEWNEIELDQFIEVDTTQFLYAGMVFTDATGYPASCDSGPALVNYGDLISWSQAEGWTSIFDYLGFDGNWNFQVYLVSEDGEREISAKNRDLTGFEIYHSLNPDGMFNLIDSLEIEYEYIHQNPEFNSLNYYRVAAIYDDNTILSNIAEIFVPDNFIINDDVIEGQKPTLTNYPNPFNPNTKIIYSLPDKQDKNLILTIYNLKGQRINKFSLPQRSGSVFWNGRDENDVRVKSGIYFIQLKSDIFVINRKCILLK